MTRALQSMMHAFALSYANSTRMQIKFGIVTSFHVARRGPLYSAAGGCLVTCTVHTRTCIHCKKSSAKLMNVNQTKKACEVER